jgi:hypothetical protein
MAFSFPWLKNPASTSTTNPSPSARNPFLPIQTHLTSFLSSLPFPRPIPSLSSPPPAASAAALPATEIEDRLAGVPVYALANSSQEFVLVSKTHGGGGATPPPALGMLCFRREDADMLLAQMDGDMRAGSTVVPVALNKVSCTLQPTCCIWFT